MLTRGLDPILSATVRKLKTTLQAWTFEDHVSTTKEGAHLIDNIVDLKGKVDSYDLHIDPLSVDAHTIDNVDGLQTALNGKLSTNGVTGSVTVVVDVDFVGQTVTTKTISYVNGQITEVV